MELDIHQTNPLLIIEDEIPKLVKKWSGKPELFELSLDHASVNPTIFGEFRKQYDVIEVMSGRTTGVGVQKVWITKISQNVEPNLSLLGDYLPIPSRFIGPNMPYDPTQMKGVYCCRRTTEARMSDTEGVKESFFFPYAEGFQPIRFCEITNALRPLHELSSITHKLSFFKVLLLEKGVYVTLTAHKHNQNKHPHMMEK